MPIPETESASAPASVSRRRLTLTSGSIFHCFHDGIADGLAVFLPLWQAAFGLTLTQVGLLVTCFEGATGFFQIPAGMMGERFGERSLLTVGTLLTAVSVIALGLATGPVMLVAILVIGGIGASVQHPLASSMISGAYNEKGRRVALGSYNFSGDVGKFLFPATAALLISGIGWRAVCAGFGLFGCLLAVVLFLLLRHFQVGDPAVSAVSKKGPRDRNGSDGWGIVHKRAFSTLSAIGIVDTAVRTALVTFFPFLLIQKGLPAESVGFALSLLFIGGAVGKFLCGALAEKIGIIATVVITESITGGGILLLTVLPLPALYPFLPVLGAALNGTSSVLYGTVADFVQPGQVARAFGLFYTFVIAAAAAAPPLMGVVSDGLGVPASIRLIGAIALATVPMALLLSKQMVHAGRKN